MESSLPPVFTGVLLSWVSPAGGGRLGLAFLVEWSSLSLWGLLFLVSWAPAKQVFIPDHLPIGPLAYLCPLVFLGPRKTIS